MPFPFMAAATLGAAALGAYGQHRANKSNRESARESMAFSERLSSTAHQRQMQDMREAGINPILSSKFGGASTPSGSGYSSENELAGAPASVASAVALKKQGAEVDLIRRQAEVATATARNYEAQTRILNASKPVLKAVEPISQAGARYVEEGMSGKYPKGSIRDWAKGVGRKFYNLTH